jgi:hypothetical protein
VHPAPLLETGKWKSYVSINQFYLSHDRQQTLSCQVKEYTRTLNSLESRRGKKPLDTNNVMYWFKNTRAAVKRAQVLLFEWGLSLLNVYCLDGDTLKGLSSELDLSESGINW